MSEWWQTFFDDGYLVAGFGPIKRRRTLADIRFIRKALSPKKGSSVIDVCCGVGRHALELARLGYRVTGVDLSEAYIQVARQRAKKRGLKETDMCRSMYVYKKLRRFRAGIESGISWLKRSFGLARCTWKGFRSFKCYVLSSVVAANLLTMARKKLAPVA